MSQHTEVLTIHDVVRDGHGLFATLKHSIGPYHMIYGQVSALIHLCSQAHHVEVRMECLKGPAVKDFQNVHMHKYIKVAQERKINNNIVLQLKRKCRLKKVQGLQQGSLEDHKFILMRSLLSLIRVGWKLFLKLVMHAFKFLYFCLRGENNKYSLIMLTAFHRQHKV